MQKNYYGINFMTNTEPDGESSGTPPRQIPLISKFSLLTCFQCWTDDRKAEKREPAPDNDQGTICCLWHWRAGSPPGYDPTRSAGSCLFGVMGLESDSIGTSPFSNFQIFEYLTIRCSLSACLASHRKCMCRISFIEISLDFYGLLQRPKRWPSTKKTTKLICF